MARQSQLMRMRCLGSLFVAGVLLLTCGPTAALDLSRAEGSLRVATFNASLVRKGAGVLITDIDARADQILAVAEIILLVRPDVLLINEIDYDPQGLALSRFVDLLKEGAGDQRGLAFEHTFSGPVNTGRPSGFDLDGDGRLTGARDAWGFGRFPGQYGMAILSQYPIGATRRFRTLPWSAVEGATQPRNPDGKPYYGAEVWAVEEPLGCRGADPAWSDPRAGQPPDAAGL